MLSLYDFFFTMLIKLAEHFHFPSCGLGESVCACSDVASREYVGSLHSWLSLQYANNGTRSNACSVSFYSLGAMCLFNPEEAKVAIRNLVAEANHYLAMDCKNPDLRVEEPTDATIDVVIASFSAELARLNSQSK